MNIFRYYVNKSKLDNNFFKIFQIYNQIYGKQLIIYDDFLFFLTKKEMIEKR